jgi:hypothetical protein
MDSYKSVVNVGPFLVVHIIFAHAFWPIPRIALKLMSVPFVRRAR